MKKFCLLIFLFLFALSGCRAGNSPGSPDHADSAANDQYAAASVSAQFTAEPAQTEQNSLNGVPIDNDTPLEQATSYPLEQLQEFFGSYSFSEIGMYTSQTLSIQDWQQTHSLVFTNEHLPSNILRYTQRQDFCMAYSIYRVEEGGFYYVFWIELAENPALYVGERPYVMDCAQYFNGFASPEAFLQLQIGQSNLEDLHTLDTGTEVTFTPNFYTSVHYLDNGLCITADYRPDYMAPRFDKIDQTSREHFRLNSLTFRPAGQSGNLRFVLSDDIPADWFTSAPAASVAAAKKYSAVQANLETSFPATPAEKVSTDTGGFTIDNTIPLEAALIVAYPLEQLQSYFSQDIDPSSFQWITEREIAQVNERFPIEVLREMQLPQPIEYISRYTVYRVQEGGYYYVFWRSSSEGTPCSYITFYLDGFGQWHDFSALIAGKNTLADVCTIDPAANLVFSPMIHRYQTIHFLKDGLCLIIDYTQPENWKNSSAAADLPKQDFVIHSLCLTTLSQSEFFIFGSVSMQDLP